MLKVKVKSGEQGTAIHGLAGVSSALACGTTGDSPSVYDSTNANSPGSTAMTCGAIEAGICSVGRGAMTTVGGTVRPGRL